MATLASEALADRSNPQHILSHNLDNCLDLDNCLAGADLFIRHHCIAWLAYKFSCVMCSEILFEMPCINVKRLSGELNDGGW